VTPIEAAARASWNATRGYGTVEWDGLAALPEETIGHRTAERHRAIVRATIAAIREPSENMLEGGWRGAGPEAPGSVWRNMIDRLLDEPSEPPA